MMEISPVAISTVTKSKLSSTSFQLVPDSGAEVLPRTPNVGDCWQLPPGEASPVGSTLKLFVIFSVNDLLIAFAERFITTSYFPVLSSTESSVSKALVVKFPDPSGKAGAFDPGL